MIVLKFHEKKENNWNVPNFSFQIMNIIMLKKEKKKGEASRSLRG